MIDIIERIRNLKPDVWECEYCGWHETEPDAFSGEGRMCVACGAPADARSQAAFDLGLRFEAPPRADRSSDGLGPKLELEVAKLRWLYGR